MLKRIEHNDILAILLRAGYCREGIDFFTPDTFSQQMGYMQRPKGYVIEPHDHNPVRRTIEWTQEVLFIKSGKVRLDLYDEQRSYAEAMFCSRGTSCFLPMEGMG